MAPVIDMHTHYLPEQYQQRLKDVPAIDVSTEDGTTILHYAGRSIPLSGGLAEIDARISWMDENDIDNTVVSVSTPQPNPEPFTEAEAIENVRAINDGYAETLSNYPDRITPLASLPLRDPEAAVEEVDRIHDTLDLPGVALPTSVNNRPLSDPAFEPIFDRIDRYDLPVFVHPTTNALSDTLDEDESMMNPLAVFPSETTIQICRMIFSGFFDRYDFDLVISHMGGTLPYLAGRFERGRTLVDDDAAPERPIEEYFQSFYYDVISFHPPAIRAAIETVGADQLMFGTDYPFGIADAEQTRNTLEEAVENDSDLEAIYSETASTVFEIE